MSKLDEITTTYRIPKKAVAGDEVQVSLNLNAQAQIKALVLDLINTVYPDGPISHKDALKVNELTKLVEAL